MKSYSIKRISSELSVDKPTAKLIRSIVRGELNREALYTLAPDVERWAEVECYNRPNLREVHMQVIDYLMGGHGVEAIEKATSHGDGRYSDYIDYVNTGDAYKLTVIHDGGRYFIASWADVAERHINN